MSRPGLERPLGYHEDFLDSALARANDRLHVDGIPLLQLLGLIAKSVQNLLALMHKVVQRALQFAVAVEALKLSLGVLQLALLALKLVIRTFQVARTTDRDALAGENEAPDRRNAQ